jgi:hypothetical protein
MDSIVQLLGDVSRTTAETMPARAVDGVGGRTCAQAQPHGG